MPGTENIIFYKSYEQLEAKRKNEDSESVFVLGI